MKILRKLFLALLLLFLVACNWDHKNPAKDSEVENANKAQVDSSKIMYNKTPLQDKTGVGPIKDKVELGMTIDSTISRNGENLFNNKCATCHEIHETNRGPALGGVLEKRSPQWVMNMILNPIGMVKNDPQARALKAEYVTQMVDLNLTKEEARDIVEYLRNY